MNFAFPPKLSSAQLKSIARLCGRSRSGTKAVIADRIVDDLKTFQPLAPGTRVLSIDLGIRNLAYSLLEVPHPNDGSPSKTAKGVRKKSVVPSSAVPIAPRLLAWERLALIPRADKVAAPKKSRRKAKTVEATPSHEAENPTAEASPATTPVLMEDFSPARLSALAVDLILNRLLPLRPDVVTLEQQRFRQMGGSGVYEWTLRVNSLESMLYAVLTLLRETDQWRSPLGRIEPVVARNVLEFMVVRDRAAGFDVGDIWGRGTDDNKTDNKKVKKDIIGRALGSAEGLVVEGAVEAVASEYLDEWQGKKSFQRKADRMKKLDDLADCLLQGLAFIHWQNNKRMLLEGGVDALQDQMLE
ncbi:mitochondrial resolvase Ydc2 [Diaporthe sp. PMI_573]|nr:mitochondrial resolvase Ydc2 [Diaporthaceae sp. PMI_573]